MVSIIVPSYNQGRFIARTLESILGQSYRPLEVIVVDGASRDDTIEILKAYAQRYSELRWISEPDAGPADAVNKGLAIASGEILAIQSSDDMYYAGSVAEVVKAFHEHENCGLIYGESDAIDLDDRILSHYSVPEFSWPAIFGISLCLPQQSIFFRQAVAAQVGGWNGKYFGCDLDYWLRLLLAAPAMKLQVTLSAWRCYPDQRTQPTHYAKILDGYRRMIEDNARLLTSVAGPQTCRLAKASYHLMGLRYHPTGNLWSKRLHALKAFFLFPSFLRHCPSELFKPLIPGYSFLRRLYRNVWPAKQTERGPRVFPGDPRPLPDTRSSGA